MVGWERWGGGGTILSGLELSICEFKIHKMKRRRGEWSRGEGNGPRTERGKRKGHVEALSE